MPIAPTVQIPTTIVRKRPRGVRSWTRYSCGRRLISIMPSMGSPLPHAGRETRADGELSRVGRDRLLVDPVALDVDALDRIPEDDRLLERALEGALEARELRRAARDVDLLDDAIELVLEVVERELDLVAEVIERREDRLLDLAHAIAGLALELLGLGRVEVELAGDRL